MPRSWTPEQQAAISARGGALLISAAAGSGKTAVLVERVISRITGNPPCDADRLLVVTFTSAAAAEMKERISLRLADLIAENPMDQNLRRQQILLANAHISTIHSFCLDLIREHFEMLNVPPDFRIADENEIRTLERDTLNGLLEERYAAESGQRGAFTDLAELLGAGRDDSMLEDTILRLYDFLRSLPDAEGWLDEKLRMYAPGTPIADTAWGAAALRHASQVLGGAIEAMKSALATARGYEELQKAYEGPMENDLSQLEGALEAANAGRWDELYGRIADFHFDRLGSPRKFAFESVKEEAKSKRDGVKDVIARLRKGILSCTEEEFGEDIRSVYPLALCLFDTVLELSRRLQAAKLSRNLLDFGDLEQLALQLLTDRTDSGAAASETARSVSRHYAEVLVDEYQDTNPIQDAIFQAVSNGGETLFMVGDVKQSIYRFRKATPEIFIEKKERFSPYGQGFPSKIILGRNFRSRGGVTGTVNFIFRQLMSKEFGEIEYGREEELIPAASFPERPEADFSLHIVDTSGYEDNDGKDELEARHIAGVIAKMIEEGYDVQGENGPRPASYRDFCILLRSTSGRAEKYRQELENAGIPAYADIAAGYLGSYEVAVMLSLLRILDNPLQDVPLLSVMLSPVFGFTPDDAAKIRIQNRRESLYLALLETAKDLGGRYAEFVRVLEELRRLAAILPADRLILRIYEQTGFLSIFEAMPAGEARRANLRLLLDYARSYEAAGYRGLAGFLRFIDRVGEQEGDLAPASSVSENADVVRIMSIHKSKGLEFPVCIVAGCSKRFNREDTQRAALFHPVYGFGCTVRDRERMVRYTTLPREIVRLETERGALAEEMRVLYVAMTRAKEKLLCVMTLPNPKTTVKKAASFLRAGSGRLDPLSASQAQNYAEWLIACALRHPDCGNLRTLSEQDIETIDCPVRWEARIVPAPSKSEGAESSEREQLTAPDENLTEEIDRRVRFSYPFSCLSRIPSKAAVSELAEKENVMFDAASARPAFLSAEELTPAQAGTALHAFLQYARLAELKDEAAVEREIERLVSARFILPEEGAAIDREKVLAFLHSDLFGRIMAAQRVWKELRFNLEAGAEEFAEDKNAEGESVILQGMADLIFEENGRLYLVDYKTDRIGETELRRRYSGQLAFYRQAVRAVLGREVSASYLYGFHKGVTIEL